MASSVCSLGELFAEIQGLKDEHNKILWLIERETCAQQNVVEQTEQSRLAIVEGNKRIEELLSTKAMSEIELEEARALEQVLSEQCKWTENELAKLLEELKNLDRSLQELRSGFISHSKSVIQSPDLGNYFSRDNSVLEVQVVRQAKDLDSEIEALQAHLQKKQKAVEEKTEKGLHLQRLEVVHKGLLQNIEGLTRDGEVESSKVRALRTELDCINVASSSDMKQLLSALNEAKEQALYWKDLTTSLDMQATLQRNKLGQIQNSMKGIDAGIKNCSLPPTWRRAVGQGSRECTSYKTATEELHPEVAVRQSRRQQAHGVLFHPIYLDDKTSRQEKEEDDQLLAPLW